MKCTLTIIEDGMQNEVDVREMTKIDPLMLDEISRDNPASIGFYGSIAAKLRCDSERQEWVVKKTKAKVAMEIRQSGSFTQGYIDDMVETHPDVIDANEKLHEMRQNYESVHSLVSALYVQKDILITLSSNMRAEQRLAEGRS